MRSSARETAIASCLCLAVMVLVPTRAFCQGTRAKDTEATIQGTWELTEVEQDGEKLSITDLADAGYWVVLRFGAGKLDWFDPDSSSPMSYKTDASKQPHSIEIVDESPGPTLHGIFRVEKSTLLLCYSVKDRPTDFRSRKGDKCVLARFHKALDHP